MQRFEHDMSSYKRGRSCTPKVGKATLFEKILTGLVVFLSVVIIIFIAYTVINYDDDYICTCGDAVICDFKIPVCQTKACVEASALILDSIDRSVAPCDNFYNFGCGTFMKESLAKNILSRMHYLKDIANRQYEYFYLTNQESSHSAIIQRKFFNACMDETAIELDGNRRFLDLLEILGGWPLLKGREYRKAFDHVEAVKAARQIGLDGEWFLFFDVFHKYEDNETNILEINMPLNADNITDKEAYVKMILDIRDIFANNPHENRSKEDVEACKEMVKFETHLARICAEESTEDAGIPEYKIGELKGKFKLSIDWLDLINNVTKQNFTKDDYVMAGGNYYLDKLHMLLQATSSKTQANYVIWKTIESLIPFLSKAVRNRYEEYIQKIEGDSYQDTDRFSFCNEKVSEKFEPVKLAEYLRTYMTKEKRKDIETLVHNIKKQYKHKIQETVWLDAETKKAALSKLQDIKCIIGGPEEMYDEEIYTKEMGLDSIHLDSDNIIDILTEIYSETSDFTFSTLTRNTDKLKMRLYATIQTVSPRMMIENNILFLPVASLLNGFHDENRPHYLNYGSIGYIIAHELTHGLSEFYLEKYDEKQDTSDARSECLMNNCQKVQNNVARWKTIDAHKFYKGDCTRTVFEDFADHMGIEISYRAYQHLAKKQGRDVRITGLKYNQNQLFWIMNAALMCQKIPPGDEELTVADHLFSPLRLLGYVRNSHNFKNDFHCPIGSNMNPMEKCDVS